MGVDRSYTRDDANGIVTDNVTGLVWQDNTSSGTPNWNNAKTYCDNLTLGSKSDWRLPSIEELLTLVDDGRYGPSIDPTFRNTSLNYYWSNTTLAGLTGNAWSVYFYFGDSVSRAKSGSNSARCVRAGQ